MGLFKYDAERFADGGAARAQAVLVSALGVHPAARALRALRLGHGDGQARVIHALSNNGALCGGSFVRADVGDDEDLRKVNSLDRIQRSLCVLVGRKQRHMCFEALADALVGAGSHRTSSQAAQAASLNESTEQNHCGVARKIIGFLQRQQCG